MMARLLLLALALLHATACARASTAVPDSRDATLVRAVVISDLNASYGSTHYPPEVARVVALITGEWRPDLVFVAGDMVAGQSPQLADSAVRAMWRAFDAAVAAPLRAARIPLVVTLGNHDGSAYPGHARDRRLAVEYWRAAQHAPDLLRFVDRAEYPLRYSVRFGHVFVTVWDATNQESATDDTLLRWLRDALASSDARRARHRVVLGHLPLYAVSEGRDRPGEVLARGDWLRRQLEDWGATLFISGHHHAFYPARRGSLDMLHAGALGEGPRPLLGSRAPPVKTVSLLEFAGDSLAITTFAVAEAGALEPVPIASLPAVVCSSRGWVGRRDLAAVDTTCGAVIGR